MKLVFDDATTLGRARLIDPRWLSLTFGVQHTVYLECVAGQEEVPVDLTKRGCAEWGVVITPSFGSTKELWSTKTVAVSTTGINFVAQIDTSVAYAYVEGRAWSDAVLCIKGYGIKGVASSVKVSIQLPVRIMANAAAQPRFDAVEAIKARELAKQYRDEAKAYSENADAKAAAAAASASAAKTSELAAQAAQAAAETAQGLAEDAQEGAVAAKTAAQTAQAAAETAQSASESARDLAQQYRDTASAKANEASASATAAAGSATAASNSVTLAQNAADLAVAAKDTAQQIATAASQYATTAQTAAQAAEASKTAAASSATSAANSATAAAASESTATTKATEAAQSATTASTKATEAAASATDAATSRDSAYNSATLAQNASTSAVAAKDTAQQIASTSAQYATNAQNSANAASASATAASTSATTASGYATTATTKANEASASATAAAASESTATTKATEATSAASTATTKATEATTASATATTKASEASASATAAATSETNAAASEDACEEWYESIQSSYRRITLMPCSGMGVVWGSTTAQITWKDPDDIELGYSKVGIWTKTEAWMKEGSSWPTQPGETGATLICKTEAGSEHPRDSYATTAYEITGLTAGQTYSIALFSYTTDGTVTIADANRYPQSTTWTPALIHQFSQAGTLLNYMSVGQLVSFNMADYTSTEGSNEIPCRLMGYDDVWPYDESVTPHAAIFQTVDCLYGAVTGYGAGIWDATEAQYGLTWDTVAITGRTYYTREGSTYTALVEGTDWNPGDPVPADTWYQKNPGGTTNNKWSESNIRQWLNATTTDNWFAQQNMWDVNAYGSKRSFFTRLECSDLLVPVKHDIALATWTGGGYETVKDKVWVPTRYEVFGTANNGIYEGRRRWTWYTNHDTAAERIKYLNGAAIAWWLASANTGFSNRAYGVAAGAESNIGGVYYNSYGFAPAFAL